MFPIHARTVTGLETILAKELADLGVQDVRIAKRGVTGKGDLATLYRVNIWCRAAIRILRPLKAFPAPDEKAYYKGIRSIDWSEWMSPTGTLAISADLRSSFTTHSLYLAQLTKDAVVDQFRDKTGKRPSVDLSRPQLKISISLFQNQVTVSLDASGDSLHKRGYRRKAGVAPLNETLAAGILHLAGWNGHVPLVDPMCGSGTFLIEAGLMAKNIAPGLLREHFGFQGWNNYDRKLHERLLAEAKRKVRRENPAPIVGVEIDSALVESARENVDRAGLRDIVRIERGDFFSWSRLPSPPGIVVMNPPYDERLPLENVTDFFERLGDALKGTYGGWRAFVLAGNATAVKSIGLRSSRRVIVYNGPIECRLLEFELRENTGHKREPRPALPLPDPPQWKVQAEAFANRLKKKEKHLGRLTKREGAGERRIYDRDIPELPFIVDRVGNDLRVTEVPRSYPHPVRDHGRYLKVMLTAAATSLGLPAEGKVIFSTPDPALVFDESAPSEPRGFEAREVKDDSPLAKTPRPPGHRLWVVEVSAEKPNC